MRRVVVDEICDSHLYLLGVPEVKAQTTDPISIGGSKPKTLELCHECWDSLTLANLRLLLEEHGQAPEHAERPPSGSGERAPGPQQERWHCPFCEDNVGRTSAVSHVWGRHTGQVAKPKQPKKCPDCDFANDRAATMGAHRTLKHGFDPLAEALAAADAHTKSLTKTRRPRRAHTHTE